MLVFKKREIMRIDIKTNKVGAIRSCLLLMMVGVFFWSCTEDNVLGLEPYNQISEEAAFSTPDLVDLSVTGMYNSAQRGYYSDGSGRGYPFGAAVIQQNDNRGEDVVNTQAFYQLTYTATYDPTTANNVYYWSDTYRLINRANIVIEGVATALENGIISPEVAADYTAQARFLRALSHFELVLHFARPYHHTAGGSHLGVPYREMAFNTEANIEAGFEQGRHTVAEVYSKALADLDAAEADLLSKEDRGGGPGITRATQEAAAALKSRIYLHMRDWNSVLQEGEKLAGTYSLEDSPNGPFANGYGNNESIFSMENSANNNPGVNAALASQYKARQLVAISPIIWNNDDWLADDLRRSDSESDGMVFSAGGVLYTNKYKDATNFSDATPIIRYAEVLLNMAEAHARLGNLDAAISTLNQVRNRSLADPATQAYTSGDLPSQEAVLEAIIFERRIEFLMEGNRWHDIHRLQGDDLVPIDGIPAKYPNGIPNPEDYQIGTPFTDFGVNHVPYDDYRFVWPIPQLEINSNPVLAGEQNPGW